MTNGKLVTAGDRLRASDVMSTDVVVVSPKLPVAAVVQMLGERHISGVPVIDEQSGKLVGVVTETDILRRLFGDAETSHGLLAHWFGDHDRQASDFAKTHGRAVSDVMTAAPLIVAEEDTPVAELAAMLAKNSIRRVPVVRNGKVVGIVSRADLLRAVLDGEGPSTTIDDRDLEQRIRRDIKREPFAAGFFGSVKVTDGVAIWEGYVPSEEIRRAVRVFTECVPGIKSVDDRMVELPHYVGPYYPLGGI